ncbi:MAG: hypothetical protein NC410_09150 [Oscillibacter sp.]|nr:hypothetical protein [Oscillibacter sp.]
MKQTIKLLSLLLLLGLGGCKYNYIVVVPAKEIKKPEVNKMPNYQALDRWNNTYLEELRQLSDSIANKMKGYDAW